LVNWIFILPEQILVFSSKYQKEMDPPQLTSSSYVYDGVVFGTLKIIEQVMKAIPYVLTLKT
jgi:hypothetical protein